MPTTSLPALVARRIKLKKQGRIWWGLCPFHPDRNPSLAVYDDHYYCYACQASGDAIGWLMRIEKLSYNEARKQLDLPVTWRRTYPPPPDPSDRPPPEPVDWPRRGVRWQETAFIRERLMQSHWSSEEVRFILWSSAPELDDEQLRLRHPYAQSYVLERLRKIYPKRE